jgi:chromosome segregation ATPase
MVIGIALIFVAAWMISAEHRRNILKGELRKLRTQVESNAREKFMLLEKINMLENAQISPNQNDWAGNLAELERQLQESRSSSSALQDENLRLKKELAEAKGSLEEVYKALS